MNYILIFGIIGIIAVIAYFMLGDKVIDNTIIDGNYKLSESRTSPNGTSYSSNSTISIINGKCDLKTYINDFSTPSESNTFSIIGKSDNIVTINNKKYKIYTTSITEVFLVQTSPEKISIVKKEGNTFIPSREFVKV